MVKVHELDVCGGVAGKLVRIDGVMLHNTSDDLPALEHAERLRKASFEQLMKGFAHYFIDDKDDVRTEQTFNATYHSANYNGNYFLVSIEIVGGVKSDKKKFLQAEQNAFWRAAIELRYYKLPVNRNTVRLHCELDVGTYTECPKRSMIEHGDWNSSNRQSQEAINKVKDYYIKEIKKYYDNPKLQPNQTIATPQPNPITQGIPKAKGGLWYRSHLSNVGWLGFVGTEETSGTTGKAIPIESIDVRWDNQTDKISASFQDIKGKWHEWEYGDTGTTGKALALSVVRFDLGLDVRNTGRTLQYRVHSADIGWSDWKNQGEVAGTSGKRIEAIQMRMLKDGKVEKG